MNSYLVFVVAAIVPFPLFAQSRSAPNAPKHSDSSVVSVQDLAVPPKAVQAFDEGVKLLKAHEFQASLTYFQAVIDAAPGNYAPYHDRAVALYNLGRFEDAARNFQKAVDFSKNSFAPPLFGLCMISYRQAEYSQAESFAQRGLSISPQMALGKYCLGLAQYSLGRTTEAQRALSKLFISTRRC